MNVTMKLARQLALAVTSAILLAASSPVLADTFTEIEHINFDLDTPGQPPSTGGINQPTSLISEVGTSILVQTGANGIATKPVVITAQAASQFASVRAHFNPVSTGLVRIEATVAFDRLADGYFLQTTAGSGTYPLAVVTRLITRASGEIQDDKTRTTVGTYMPNHPFRIRMDIDMSAHVWSVSVDNEMNGFADNPVTANLPFANSIAALPSVGEVWASLSLFPTYSVAPTSVAYDDISVLLPSVPVVVDIKPGSSRNSINPKSAGVIPVAILTTSSFDATTVDPTTVRFGVTGMEAAPVSSTFADVDGDGKMDLILKFPTQETGIQCATTSASLTGKTLTGVSIAGSDSVRTVGCR